MLCLLSPAKIQNFSSPAPVSKFTQPAFIAEAASLIEQLRSYSVNELAGMLKANLKIAESSANSYHRWHMPFDTKNAKQAGFVYDGEAFRGLDSETMSTPTIDYLQNHLIIFSSLYGMLRPLDLIQAYRLDQLTRFKTEAGQNLYKFWKEKLTAAMAEALKKSDNPAFIANLASAEYFKIIDWKKLNVKVLDFEFLQYQPDTDSYKQITIYTKKARGMMVRFIAEHQIADPEELKAFSSDGYWFSEELSDDSKLVYIR